MNLRDKKIKKKISKKVRRNTFRRKKIILQNRIDSAPNKSKDWSSKSISDDNVVDDEVFSYDKNLLGKARTQWQFGDWENLSKLNLDRIENHPDRTKLALFAAAGLQQCNDLDGAKKMVDLAISWGCSGKLIYQILISGVYNSLGKAAAALGQAERATRHFESSIKVATSDVEARLLIPARIGTQMAQLGVTPDKASQFLSIAKECTEAYE